MSLPQHPITSPVVMASRLRRPAIQLRGCRRPQRRPKGFTLSPVLTKTFKPRFYERQNPPPCPPLFLSKKWPSKTGAYPDSLASCINETWMFFSLKTSSNAAAFTKIPLAFHLTTLNSIYTSADCLASVSSRLGLGLGLDYFLVSVSIVRSRLGLGLDYFSGLGLGLDQNFRIYTPAF